MEWHAAGVEKALKKLGTSAAGLSADEARDRLAEYGPNSIAIEKKISPLSIFINQFKNVLVALLLLAAAVSFAISLLNPAESDILDAILILAIVVANALFGFMQEYKAEKTIEALTRMAAPRATVIRNGAEEEIAADSVVPGDILILAEGDKVAADARLIECFSMYADESMLTGESVPSGKSADTLKSGIALAERSNMVFMNSVVTRGRGTGVVVGTGLRTEIGKIAKEISEAPDKVTRFQIEIEDVGKKVSVITLGALVVIAASRLILSSGDIIGVFIAAVALGVAAIPEGLPAVVTLALSIATNRMLRQNVLMRRLSTIQDLGSVDVICTDKTGTLTENVMTVTKVYLDGIHWEVTGKGYDKGGHFTSKGGNLGDLGPMLRCAILCNDAREAGGSFKGDPTEIAVLIPAYKAGLDAESIRRENRRVGEVSFSAERKMMTTFNRNGGAASAYSKGAPEVILSRCDRMMEKGQVRRLTAESRKRIIEHNNRMAGNAMRVLAFAFRDDPPSFGEDAETGMVFLGLMGMMDPPRSGVKEAVEDCRRAGIRVIMITGDNRHTAEAVGRELGFAGASLTGTELDALDERGLVRAAEGTDIFARTSPKHKVMLLKALKANGHIVCMTGDGVNDAAAIKNSDVGIAMGIRGTEVTKQASDIIILDDSFTAIRDSIAEGRGTFDNIRKFVVYLLGANIAEVLIVFIATIASLGISPKIAIQLLWINLVTDGLPALALGVDPPEGRIMERKPRRKEERMIDMQTSYLLMSIGLSATAAILAVYYHMISLGDAVKAQSVLFTTFVILEMLIVYAVRFRYGSSLRSNRWLHLAVFSSIALQALIIYSPLNSFFGIVPLGISEIEEVAAVLVIFIALLSISLRLEPALMKSLGRPVPEKAESALL
ncbi:MAG: cation-transporting P-type ATPase [Candidatus Micrarchaeia archaeon]